jgi:hypothetical protein
MAASTYDITVEQGATFSLVVTWRDSGGALIDLTGYSAKMDIRRSVGGALIKALASGSGITLGGAAGTITITISAVDTGTFTESGVYDLELTTGSTITRLLQGAMSVSPQVTTS